MTQAIPTYLVRDRQGNIFGPADEPTLRAWVGEGRIVAGMELAMNGPLATRRWEEASSHPAVADLLREPVAPGPGRAEGGDMTGLTVSSAGSGGGTGTAPGDTGMLNYSTPTQKLNILALLSTIFGGVSLPAVCCCSVVSLALSIAALVVGLIGLSQINKNPEVYTGKPLAIIGSILGAVGALISIALLVLTVVMQFVH